MTFFVVVTDSNLFFIWIDPYFYCPVYLSHPDFSIY